MSATDYDRKIRKIVDWDSIEPLYRAGILSNYEICRQYANDHTHTQTWKPSVTETAIRKRAKEKGWQRDIADRVVKAVREKLVRGEVRETNISDEDAIEIASDGPFRIGISQRHRTVRLLQIQDELTEELRANKDDIDVVSRIRGFKDIAAAVKLLQDQQAVQYNLSATTNMGSVNMIEVEFIGMN